MRTKDSDLPVPPIQEDALPIAALDGEVVISGRPNPSLTPAAARKTAQRLFDAADEAERSSIS